jgi:hypothetical protein
VVEEKLAQKKEELEKEIKENNLIKNEQNNSNTKIEFMDIFYSVISHKSMSNNFS